MMLPVWLLVVLGFFLLVASFVAGFVSRYFTSFRDGVFALIVRRSGVNSNATVEIIQKHYDTGNYLFRTPSNDKFKIRPLGFFNTVKYETLVDADDVLEIDSNHCLIGVKCLNLAFQDELSKKIEQILLLRGKADALEVENSELKNQLQEKVQEIIGIGKDSLTVPIMPVPRKR